MEIKTIIERYGKYYDVIHSLGTIPLEENPTAKDIGIETGSGLYQSAFKEMKQMRFKGTLIDYISLISALYLINLWVESIENLDEGKALKKLLDLCDTFEQETSNLVRIFFKDPNLILKSKSAEIFGKKIKTINLFDFMGKIRYLEYNKYDQSDTETRKEVIREFLEQLDERYNKLRGSRKKSSQ